MPLFTREACACQEDSSASCVLAGICYNPLFLRVYVYVTGGGGGEVYRRVPQMPRLVGP